MDTLQVYFRKLLLTVGFLLFSLGGLSVFGQQDTIPTVEVSNDKVSIGGKLYNIHVVKKGQTLYSISQAYGVSEKDIAAENISVMYGPLQVGQALKIPVSERQALQQPELDDSDRFIFHTVKARQTLFFLSKKYGMHIDSIVKYNPQTQDGTLQIDQVVRIPKNAVDTKEKRRKKTDQDFFYYTVQPGDTPYLLSKRYRVSIDELVTLNPTMVEGLKAGQRLRIPFREGQIEHVLETAREDTAFTAKDTVEMPTIDSLGRVPVEFDCTSEFDRFKTYKIAYVLPFNLKEPNPEETDTLLLEDDGETDQRPEHVSRDNIFLEFYEGALMAIDSLKRLGMKMDVYVFDTERSPDKTRAILNEIERIEPDIIIGPVFRENIQLLSEYANEKGIPLISPILNEPRTLFYNPYFFQVMPNRQAQIEVVCDYLTGFSEKNFILIHKGDSVLMPEINQFRKTFYESLREQGILDSVILKEVILDEETTPDLMQSLVRDTQNLVVIPSHSETYVSSVLSRLNLLAKAYNIEVFGEPQWQRFENIDPDYFHNLQVQIYTPFYFELDDPEISTFIKKYHTLFKNVPVRYTFSGFNFTYLGYDISFYFGNALRIFGNQFPGCLEFYNAGLLMTDYHFVRESIYTGFQNTATKIIKYTKDYNIEVVHTDE
ncbi:MAG: LysM peptidoglycan-binding domain-containing protein [Bacteroidota bacterium]